MAKATFREADVKRALKPALSLGLTVTRFEIGAEGQIVVYTAAEGESSADAALAEYLKQHGAR